MLATLKAACLVSQQHGAVCVCQSSGTPLDSNNISVALDELNRELRFGGRVTCNLSSSGLTLDVARGLPHQLRSLSADTRVYALDLSLNRITAGWAELLPIVRDFLSTKTVEIWT